MEQQREICGSLLNRVPVATDILVAVMLAFLTSAVFLEMDKHYMYPTKGIGLIVST